MKLHGTILMILCGAGCGIYLSAAYRGRTDILARTADMLLGLSIMLDYGDPTVEEMLSGLTDGYSALPCYMKKGADRDEIIAQLKSQPDGMSRADSDRLAEFFTLFGSADKLSEQKRLSSVRAYFLQRTEQERPANERRAELARKLGILGGIFAAVMIL